jgi:hypothetical protein
MPSTRLERCSLLAPAPAAPWILPWALVHGPSRTLVHPLVHPVLRRVLHAITIPVHHAACMLHAHPDRPPSHPLLAPARSALVLHRHRHSTSMSLSMPTSANKAGRMRNACGMEKTRTRTKHTTHTSHTHTHTPTQGKQVAARWQRGVVAAPWSCGIRRWPLVHPLGSSPAAPCCMLQ